MCCLHQIKNRSQIRYKSTLCCQQHFHINFLSEVSTVSNSVYSSFIIRSLRRKKRTPYVETTSISPFVRDFVSAAKTVRRIFVKFVILVTYMRLLRNSIQEWLTRSYRLSGSFVKIGKATAILYLIRASISFYISTVHVSWPVWVKFDTENLHVMLLGKL